MGDHFEEVRCRARRRRMQPKPPRRPSASTDGRQAFRAGAKLADNPYPASDPEHADWRQAWYDAREDVT